MSFNIKIGQMISRILEALKDGFTPTLNQV